MKIAGTLKLEIIKPTNCTWEEAGARMMVLSRTLAPALSSTQRQLWPGLQEALECFRNKDENAKGIFQKATNSVYEILHREWNSEIQRFKNFLISNGKNYPDIVFDNVLEYHTAECRNYILDRWTGDHLRDLLANRSSVPSWTSPCAFFMRSRACEVSGLAKEARLRVPLWGQGKKATEFVVAPCGHGHMALWDRLVSSQTGALEQQRVSLTRALKEAKKKKDPNASSILQSLEKLEAIKLGRVGIVRDKRKGKWYALVSWTQVRPAIPAAGSLSAVCNFGVNRFIMVMAQGGKVLHEESGRNILAVRKKFSHRRRQLQESINTMGSGSKGRGEKRRFRPITELEDKEARYCETASRQIAAAIAAKCQTHGIKTLYVEDLTDIRDSFESKSNGEAHENVKRYIHSWGYYQLQQHLDRACSKVGVTVQAKPAPFVSQDCPDCGNRDPENVKIIRRKDYVAVQEWHNRTYYSWDDPRTMFECTKCGRKADGDQVACVNHLKHLGLPGTIQHSQSEQFKTALTPETTNGQSHSAAE